MVEERVRVPKCRHNSRVGTTWIWSTFIFVFDIVLKLHGHTLFWRRLVQGYNVGVGGMASILACAWSFHNRQPHALRFGLE